ncbi:hypothetical protein OS493_008423 [Desmophyllum pertusum]|uniref:Uncharacterized protein n=1 Tax=Desmophyllum pertusum TaxID=174260 RepID=A0A9X0A5F6_9CNID|nr:hypothetical protein OS493_008423 [Desmophyllum pertusum]
MRWLYVLALFMALAASDNPEENAGVSDLDLFEGDMIISTDQRMAAEKGLDIDNPLGRASTKNKQWPGGLVPYIIASEISDHPLPRQSLMKQ